MALLDLMLYINFCWFLFEKHPYFTLTLSIMSLHSAVPKALDESDWDPAEDGDLPVPDTGQTTARPG